MRGGQGRGGPTAGPAAGERRRLRALVGGVDLALGRRGVYGRGDEGAGAGVPFVRRGVRRVRGVRVRGLRLMGVRQLRRMRVRGLRGGRVLGLRRVAVRAVAGWRLRAERHER